MVIPGHQFEDGPKDHLRFHDLPGKPKGLETPTGQFSKLGSLLGSFVCKGVVLKWGKRDPNLLGELPGLVVMWP